MKLWKIVTSFTVSLLIFSGCTTTPKPAEGVVVDPTLPIVTLTKNGVFADTNAIAFEWKNITDPRVKGIYVYKKDSTVAKGDDKSGDYYATLTNRFVTHYLDREITPDTKYMYYFKTFSDDAESKKSKMISVNSLPVLNSVSWIHSIAGLPRSAKIIWRPHTNQKVKSYIIERKTSKDEKWEELTTVDGRLNAEYIDTGLKDNYTYKYRIRVLTYDDIVSTPSEIVQVITKALPKPITGIKATTKVPKVIKLTWDKAKNKDFARYFVYRSDEPNGTYELIAKLYNNKFTDKINEDGKDYFYRISNTDKDGLESKYEQTTIQGATLSKPKSPTILGATLVDDKVELSWSKTDPRIKSYIILRESKKGWFDTVSKEIKDIRTTKYTDKDIKPETSYTYVVYGVDENNIRSKPSVEVKIVSKETPTDDADKKPAESDKK